MSEPLTEPVQVEAPVTDAPRPVENEPTPVPVDVEDGETTQIQQPLPEAVTTVETNVPVEEPKIEDVKTVEKPKTENQRSGLRDMSDITLVCETISNAKSVETIKTLGALLTSAMLARCLIACGGNARTIQIWDVVGGICKQTLKGHDGSVNSIAKLRGGGFISGSDDFTIKVWNLAGACVLTLRGHTAIVRSVIQLEDGHIASASHDATIRIWDMSREKCIKVLSQQKDHQVLSVTEIRSGLLASSSSNGEVKLWDVENGNCTSVLKGHEGPVYSVITSSLSDGKLVSCGYDGKIIVWDIDQLVAVRTLKAPCRVWSVVQQENNLLSAGDDGIMRMWEQDCTNQVKGHPAFIRALGFGDNMLVTGGADGTLCAWNVSQEKGFSWIKKLNTKQNLWCVLCL